MDAAGWLTENAIPIATLDLEAPFDDLQPLREVLDGVRVVQLGEQSHGSATAFRAKARLIRFLHEEMGFNVLAFESGMYECDKANEILLASGSGEEVLRAGIFACWHCPAVLELFDYMAARARTDRPLRLAGFDPQMSGEACKTRLSDLLEWASGVVEVSDDDREALEKVGKPWAAPPSDDDTWDVARSAFSTYRSACLEQADTFAERMGEGECVRFLRLLDDYDVYLDLQSIRREQEALPKEQRTHRQYGTVRDARMAENLVWLAETRYPDEKIVTWAHTYHNAYGLAGVTRDGEPSYEGVYTMGEGVKAHFGDAVYSVGFSASSGTQRHFWEKPKEIEPPPEGSLEDELHQYGKLLLFVDLGGDGPFSGRIVSTQIGYAAQEACWSEIMDGVLYTREMEPKQKLPSDEPQPPEELSEGANLIVNGRIEDMDGDMPVGWAHREGAPDPVTFAVDDEIRLEVGSSLRITNTDESVAGNMANWRQQVDADGPGRYSLSAVRKACGVSEEASIAICVQCRDADDDMIHFATSSQEADLHTGDRDWERIGVSFEAPEGTESLLLFVLISGEGTVWFDDVELGRVE